MNRPTRNTLFGCVLCLILAGFFACSAKAQDRTIYGGGMITCAEWQNYRQTGNSPMSLQAQSYVDGFLSGFNFASEGPDFILLRTKPIALYAWIDNYCAGKPLDRLATAIIRLKDDLITRTH
jgi:hypothetical protein